MPRQFLGYQPIPDGRWGAAVCLGVLSGVGFHQHRIEREIVCMAIC